MSRAARRAGGLGLALGVVCLAPAPGLAQARAAAWPARVATQQAGEQQFGARQAGARGSEDALPGRVAAAGAAGVSGGMAEVLRAPRRYHGVVGGRTLHVGLGLPGPGGRLAGTAVLLDEAGRVVSTGAVQGTADGASCSLDLALGDTTAHLAGACRLAALSGTLDEVRHHPFGLGRFLLAKDPDRTTGEVWLTAGP